MQFLTHGKQQKEAQLPQRDSASAKHVFLGWLIDHAIH